MLDFKKKKKNKENGFQGPILIFISMAITQISFVQSRITFQAPWQQPKEVYEDETGAG